MEVRVPQAIRPGSPFERAKPSDGRTVIASERFEFSVERLEERFSGPPDAGDAAADGVASQVRRRQRQQLFRPPSADAIECQQPTDSGPFQSPRSSHAKSRPLVDPDATATRGAKQWVATRAFLFVNPVAFLALKLELLAPAVEHESEAVDVTDGALPVPASTLHSMFVGKPASRRSRLSSAARRQ
jgi:hypothetical protein